MKIAYYIRTDVQHLPPVILLQKSLGGIIITKTKEIYDFAKDKNADLEIVLVKNSSEARKICSQKEVKIVVYTGYQNISWGYSVQIFHGISDKKYDENKKILQYDLLLLNGQKQFDKILNAGYLQKPKRFKMVGYPKFDKLLNNDSKIKNIFDNGNKTILYAPTWISENSGMKFNFSEFGESSLPLWGKKLIRSIAKEGQWNLIIKYHSRINKNAAAIYQEIDDLIKELRAEAFIKVVWDSNITPYMQIADLMISDISAVCYEWFHLDKPIVFANPSPENYKVSTEKNSSTSAWIAGEVIDREDKIIPAISQSLKNDTKKEIRNNLLKYSFYKPDGKAGERQIAEIKKLYNKVENYSKIRLVFHNFLKILGFK